MVKRLSSLNSNYRVENFSQNLEVDLSLEEKRNLQLTQVACWPNTFSNICFKISEELNIENCTIPNQAITKEKATVIRVEPLKWWVIGGDIKTISSEFGSKLDLSHAFTHIQISGSVSSLFLNRHLPIDLRENSFPINKFASSAIHHVSIKLWRSNNAYNLFIPRGFAFSLWEIFLETAKQFNFEVK